MYSFGQKIHEMLKVDCSDKDINSTYYDTQHDSTSTTLLMYVALALNVE